MVAPITQYWMVHELNSEGTSVKHRSNGEAAAEARRLASKHPGRVFVVLAAVEAFVIPEPSVVRVQVVP